MNKQFAFATSGLLCIISVVMIVIGNMNLAIYASLVACNSLLSGILWEMKK